MDKQTDIEGFTSDITPSTESFVSHSFNYNHSTYLWHHPRHRKLCLPLLYMTVHTSDVTPSTESFVSRSFIWQYIPQTLPPAQKALSPTPLIITTVHTSDITPSTESFVSHSFNYNHSTYLWHHPQHRKLCLPLLYMTVHTYIKERETKLSVLGVTSEVCTVLTSPPAQKALSPAPLIITIFMCGSFSHSYKR